MVSTQPWSDSQKRTEVYLVAPEALAELVAVDLENTIILCEAMRPDPESDGWGAEDMAEEAVVGLSPVPIDLLEQPFQCIHRRLRVVHQPLIHDKIFPSLRNVGGVSALLPTLELSNLTPPELYLDAVISDPEFDRIESTRSSKLGSLAEQEDVSSRRTGVVNVVEVDVLG
jgi:hypothetical protein